MRKFWLSAGIALLIFLAGVVYFYCTIGSDYTADLFLSAAQWSEQRRLERPAELLYRLALRFNQYSSEARFALADLYERQQQLSRAEDTLTNGILQIPSNPQLYLHLAAFYVRNGQIPSAVTLLDNAPAGYVRTSLSGKRPQLRIAPEAGRFSGIIEVTLRSDETSTLYYTTDGSDPTTASPRYQQPITLDIGSHQLRVIAVSQDGIPSALETRQYEITEPSRPVFSPGRWVACPCCGRWSKLAD